MRGDKQRYIIWSSLVKCFETEISHAYCLWQKHAKGDGVEVEVMGVGGWRRKRLLSEKQGTTVGAKLVLRRVSLSSTPLLLTPGKTGQAEVRLLVCS